MKTKLLSLLIFPAAFYAQTPVDRIFPDDDTVWELTTSGTALNETSGANQTWIFDQLVSLGQTVYTHGIPAAGDLTTYPNSNGVLQSAGTGNVFFNWTANALSVTGVASDELNLNYAENNALLGAFPMDFGYTSTDVTAGTYSGMGYSGTFTGTVSTSVDAYGTLSANISYSPGTPINVTRVRVVQQLSLNYLIFTGIGTATQTVNTYFNETAGPVFRTTTLHISVPQLSIDETSITTETLIASLLSMPQPTASRIGIAPNPVTDVLHINGATELLVSAEIFDVSGKRLMLAQNPAQEINVEGLANGIYFVTIKTGNGTQTRKFIKK